MGGRDPVLEVLAALGLLLIVAPVASGQQSASYVVEARTFNAGGRPEDGQTGQSAGYAVSTEALGEPLAATQIASGSYRIDGGFAATFAPVGEVRNLRFAGADQLVWDNLPYAWSYSVYRDVTTVLPGSFGACAVSGVVPAQWTDFTEPSSGSVFFYLVTATDRLAHEGTPGFSSDGVERLGVGACP